MKDFANMTSGYSGTSGISGYSGHILPGGIRHTGGPIGGLSSGGPFESPIDNLHGYPAPGQTRAAPNDGSDSLPIHPRFITPTVGNFAGSMGGLSDGGPLGPFPKAAVLPPSSGHSGFMGGASKHSGHKDKSGHSERNNVLGDSTQISASASKSTHK